MDIFAAFHARIRAALDRLVERGNLPGGRGPSHFTVEPLRDGRAGDLVTNAAWVYGRAQGRGAAALADDLARALGEDPDVAGVAAAGGFVEVTLQDRAAASALAAALALEDAFGRGEARSPVLVAAGLPSAVVGLGWARVAIVADALARLLAFAGRDVTLICEPANAAAALRSLGVGIEVGDGSGRVAAPDAVRIAVRQTGDPISSLLSSGGWDVIAVKPGRLKQAIGAVGPEAAANLSQIIAAVGLDALRFAMLACRCDSAFDLDAAAVVDRSYAALPFVVRYAHARARKILRDARLAFPDLDLSPAALACADLTLLSDAGEVAIRRQVIRFPHVVATAAAARAPHRLAGLLCDLAGAVHHQWNRSKDQPQLRFVNEEQRDLTKARVGLMTASTIVLRSGLAILGVTAPDEMD